MRNLLNIVLRFHHILVFLLLEIVAFALLVRYNNYQRASFLHTASATSGSVYELTNNLTQYIELREQNASLLAENAELKAQLKASHFKVTAETDFVIDTVYRQRYEYLGAKVLNRSTNKARNMLSLDRGSEHGIRADMAVIGPNGAVGIVQAVSKHYSVVLPIIHNQSQLSARISKNDYFGLLKWEGSDPRSAVLNNIPNHVIIGEGDTIVTDGASALFPAGVPIGLIQGFKQVPGSNYYRIEVSLLTNFENLSYVYVVRNLLKEEQLQLEESVNDPDE